MEGHVASTRESKTIRISPVRVCASTGAYTIV